MGDNMCPDDLMVTDGAGIVSMHAHDFTVPAADIAAGVTKTYEMGMGGMHTHSVRISAADFARLAAGEEVMVGESMMEPGADESAVFNMGGEGNGHTHAMTLVCG